MFFSFIELPNEELLRERADHLFYLVHPDSLFLASLFLVFPNPSGARELSERGVLPLTLKLKTSIFSVRGALLFSSVASVTSVALSI